MIARVLLGTAGALVAAYGAFLALTRQETGQLVEVAVWLAAGVLVHDVLLSGALLLAGLAGRRLVPPSWRTPATVALVVWGSLTLVAVPVLGRFGARADNPTLLDRPYAASWLVLLVATVTVVVLVGLVRRRSATASTGRRAD
ncbi:hypothetical protein [Nocardioides terrigena]|uniref:hypothetical protein n=1 Tax=Nocardioides terrigena TaxID=424797 RepID=UPI000D323133|nr:hypothetical protein [Nocardioides terrigena]